MLNGTLICLPFFRLPVGDVRHRGPRERGLKTIPEEESAVAFKRQAARPAQTKDIGVVAMDLGLTEQTLYNGLDAVQGSKPAGAGTQPVTITPMEWPPMCGQDRAVVEAVNHPGGACRTLQWMRSDIRPDLRAARRIELCTSPGLCSCPPKQNAIVTTL